MKKQLIIVTLIFSSCSQSSFLGKKASRSLRCVCDKTESKPKLTVDIDYKGKDCDKSKTKACKKECKKCGYKSGDFLKKSIKKK